MDFVVINDDTYILDNPVESAEVPLRLLVEGIESVPVYRIPTVYKPSWDIEDYDYSDQLTTNLKVFAHDMLRKSVMFAAKEAAKVFVEQFGESLDPAKTDWDSTAYTEFDSNRLFCEYRPYLQKLLSMHFWDLYQSTLIETTKILCEGK